MGSATVQHRRRSIRLKNYDYAQAGAYFVTLCTRDRACLFGDVRDDKICLNADGQVADECWATIPDHVRGVSLDVWVVMPNHVHGIVVIDSTDHVGAPVGAPVGAQHAAPLQPLQPLQPLPHRGVPSGSLAAVVRSFKSAVTKRINDGRGTPGAAVWQRNYYDHIIRSEESLNRIRQYILDNPARWSFDRENPCVTQAEPEDAWRA